MRAGNRAARGAALGRDILAADVLDSVLFEWFGRVAALLRTVVHQAVFANVQIARARAAAPLIGPAVRDIVLEKIQLRVTALGHALHPQVDFALFGLERLQLAPAIVNDADGRSESQLDSAPSYLERVFGIVNAAAHHGIDVDVKLGVFGQQFELLVQHFQALFRNVVGPDIVDRDLQMLEASVIQTANAVGGEQIAVSDHARHNPVTANARDDVIELGMQQGLASAQGDDGGPQLRQAVEAATHDIQRHGRREIVILVAVRAGEITPADRDDVGQHRMIGREHALDDHHELAGAPVRGFPTSSETEAQICHSVRSLLI